MGFLERQNTTFNETTMTTMISQKHKNKKMSFLITSVCCFSGSGVAATHPNNGGRDFVITREVYRTHRHSGSKKLGLVLNPSSNQTRVDFRNNSPPLLHSKELNLKKAAAVTQSPHSLAVTQSPHSLAVTQSPHSLAVTQSPHSLAVTQSQYS